MFTFSIGAPSSAKARYDDEVAGIDFAWRMLITERTLGQPDAVDEWPPPPLTDRLEISSARSRLGSFEGQQVVTVRLNMFDASAAHVRPSGRRARSDERWISALHSNCCNARTRLNPGEPKRAFCGPNVNYNSRSVLSSAVNQRSANFVVFRQLCRRGGAAAAAAAHLRQYECE